MDAIKGVAGLGATATGCDAREAEERKRARRRDGIALENVVHLTRDNVESVVDAVGAEESTRVPIW